MRRVAPHIQVFISGLGGLDPSPRAFKGSRTPQMGQKRASIVAGFENVPGARTVLDSSISLGSFPPVEVAHTA